MFSNSNEKESLLSKLSELILANISNDQFGVNELDREMGMSRSNLHRKVKASTGNSISKLICGVKVNKANALLRETSATISEIAFETGFHSVTYFTKCYKDHFGYPPGEERKRLFKLTQEEDLQPPGIKQGIGRKRIPIIYLYASSAAVVLLLLFLIIKQSPASKEVFEKSIAVLPFINDSPDEENAYFINGIMESILNNLRVIEDLRVVSRTSTEQYRDNPKPMQAIGKEMNVSYVIKGSGQREGDHIRLSIQLIDAVHDRHVWSDTYKRTNEYFDGLLHAERLANKGFQNEAH